jgi:hypothetical protein
MSEYSEKRSKAIQEDVEMRCHEARRDADWWAAHCKARKTEQEIIEESKKRYNSFFERDAFIREAEEVFIFRLSRSDLA